MRLHITINGERYTLSFRHYTEAVIRKGRGRPHQTDEYVTSGYSYCHDIDPYDKVEGEIRAMEQALKDTSYTKGEAKDWTSKERKQIWLQFLAKRKPEALKRAIIGSVKKRPKKESTSDAPPHDAATATGMYDRDF